MAARSSYRGETEENSTAERVARLIRESINDSVVIKLFDSFANDH